MADPRQLRTVKQLCRETGLSYNTVRGWIYGEAWNGLRPALIRIGRSIFVDVPAFSEWLEAHRGREPQRRAAPVRGLAGK